MIGGLQKVTLLDFPGKVACTVFLTGCNLRCPYCHNPDLVLTKDNGKYISEKEFFEFLLSRKGKLDGVCITGGEPTLYPNLTNLIRRIREMGFLIKLDSNGTAPEKLEHLLRERSRLYSRSLHYDRYSSNRRWPCGPYRRSVCRKSRKVRYGV